MKDERRVKSVADDVPDRYAPVDEQLLADYPELEELIRQQQEGGH